MITTPPIEPPSDEPVGGMSRGGWHQDSGRLNHDLEGSPRPRVSMKVPRTTSVLIGKGDRSTRDGGARSDSF